jgi:hypothetical protein
MADHAQLVRKTYMVRDQRQLTNKRQSIKTDKQDDNMKKYAYLK